MNIRREDQVLMSLVHYFVTKENYSPIFVQGVKDEIWLEKLDGPYRVIRINSNRIFNNEQFKFDQFRIKNILSQIKRKTLSFTINALNINLNEDPDVNEEGLKNVDNLSISNLDDVQNNKELLEIFPDMRNGMYTSNDGLELLFNVTNDINARTERENARYKRIFSGKKCWFTYFVMIACLIMFAVEFVLLKGNFKATNAVDILGMLGANCGVYLQNGFSNILTSLTQSWRLVAYAFLHGGWMHIIMNMYSLFIIGPQTEARYGTKRFIFIYLISAICGALLSAGINPSVMSVGASGAIFGVLGALVYFGMKFRLYFKDSLLTRLIPVIVVNLIMSFLPGIDASCHIGGLIGGYLAAMAVGIPETDNRQDSLNGSIILVIFILFLLYLAFIGI